MCTHGVQVPSAPTNLSVTPFSGDDSALLVTFDPPVSVSRFGESVTKYSVQWSTSSRFSSYRSLEYSGHHCSPIIVSVTTDGGEVDVSGGSFRLTVNKRGMNDTTDVIAYDAAAQIDDALQQRLPGNVTMQSRLQQLRNVDYVAVSRQSLGRGRFMWTITFLDEGDADDAVKVAVMSSDLVPKSAGITLSHGRSTRQSAVVSGMVPGESYHVRVYASSDDGRSDFVTSPHSHKPQTAPGAPRNVVVTSHNRTALRVAFSSPENDGGESVVSFMYGLPQYNSFSPFCGRLGD